MVEGGMENAHPHLRVTWLVRSEPAGTTLAAHQRLFNLNVESSMGIVYGGMVLDQNNQSSKCCY
jgi:hypothetical protein